MKKVISIPKRILCVYILLTMLATPLNGLAHSGRTDSNGGHWDRKRGTYHYHNGGGSSSSSSSSSRSSSSSSSSSGSSSSKSKSAPAKKTIRVSGVKVSRTTIKRYMYVGYVYCFDVDVEPYDADDRNVTWSTGKTSVASITNTGSLTAKSAGITTVKATAKDGSKKSGSIEIYVIDELTEDDFPITKDSPKSHITSMQTILILLGDLDGKADGIWGKRTSAALSNAAIKRGTIANEECSYSLYCMMLDDVG